MCATASTHRAEPQIVTGGFTMATAAPVNRTNGVDLDALMGTVEAIQQDRDLGIARFRASNTWTDGSQNRTTVSGFYGAKEEIAHAQAFTDGC